MSKAAELAALIGSGQAQGNKNLIINGAMQVVQRGTVTGHTSGYGGPDRFQFHRSGAAAVTLSQDTSVPSGQGFSNSFKIDVTTADTSLAAGDYALFQGKIEAQNLQHLLYGTSEAKRVTLQFWVKSAKTGVHIVGLNAHDAGYYNNQSYTIASANTWQKVVMTFDGYQSGGITNDNGIGFTINWWLAAGSTYSGGTLASNTWHNIQANRAVGQVNVMDSTSNEWYITGIQLEIGDVATPFEHRSYGDELRRCQRYYLKLGGADINGGGYYRYGVGSCQGINNSNILIKPTVTMRTTPTLETTGTVSNYGIYEADAIHACTGLPSFNSGNSNPNGFAVSFTTTNGLVASGNASEALNNNSTTAYLAFSAEI